MLMDVLKIRQHESSDKIEKYGHRIRHYLEDEDATPSIEGNQCIGLGIERGQFL